MQKRLALADCFMTKTMEHLLIHYQNTCIWCWIDTEVKVNNDDCMQMLLTLYAASGVRTLLWVTSNCRLSSTDCQLVILISCTLIFCRVMVSPIVLSMSSHCQTHSNQVCWFCPTISPLLQSKNFSKRLTCKIPSISSIKPIFVIMCNFVIHTLYLPTGLDFTIVFTTVVCE